ncbi:hypothetical protein L596_000279 [Steinernema carpocapsae]|uniref:Uncharacterized protein n=1 Tax=Steinernema carpocapsae TaxID=34508 RepID=A0A4U8UK38_STECR|nr:hypothetical protein L596_000279 [Steinernema carpocapsae]
MDSNKCPSVGYTTTHSIFNFQHIGNELECEVQLHNTVAEAVSTKKTCAYKNQQFQKLRLRRVTRKNSNLL